MLFADTEQYYFPVLQGAGKDTQGDQVGAQALQPKTIQDCEIFALPYHHQALWEIKDKKDTLPNSYR